ncbi:hypothetical protein E2562_005847 [Oryza meyeriana var. granulata]|uniref:Fucosyltransferase n=1 Tax=Oryza meyeriana var. granulata TaxID=110450 RepID=A0A6G1CCP5_9ORYZ|nr:hypothetical protein E2562_005847 [Oryza meyeriana var. granulata]
MERSGGAGADGDEERLPLHLGFQTERAALPWAAAAEAKQPPRGRFGRASVRAALAVCFLAIPAVLLLQRWQAGSSPEWLFEIEPPAGDDRDIQDDLPDDLSPSQYIGYDKFLGGLLLEGFDESSPESYGNMLQNKVVGGNTDRSLAGSRPPYVFLYLDGNYEFHDKLFFCEDDQQFLESVPWLIMRTDMSYLAKADKTVGIQIRIFEKEGILQRNGRFPHVLEQILSCAQNEKLLPGISMIDEAPTVAKDNRTIAVLTTSLSPWYSNEIRKKYSEHRTVDGTTVKVFQPSHEEYQRSKNKKHNMKALAEIYLLSMTDMLITSGFSTFGYAAQGLSGLTPWIMFRSENHVVPDPPCRRAMSIEPCFHQAPFYDCKAKRNADLGKMVPYVRHCEDVSWGLKVVNQTQW